MLRKVSSEFEIAFERSGGSIITALIDIWKPDEDQWVHVAALAFNDTLKRVEKIKSRLERGQYTSVFQCFVRESLNGRYDFNLLVDSKSTFVGSGDVNTTAASNDSKVFKDQFVLDVK